MIMIINNLVFSFRFFPVYCICKGRKRGSWSINNRLVPLYIRPVTWSVNKLDQKDTFHFFSCLLSRFLTTFTTVIRIKAQGLIFHHLHQADGFRCRHHYHHGHHCHYQHQRMFTDWNDGGVNKSPTGPSIWPAWPICHTSASSSIPPSSLSRSSSHNHQLTYSSKRASSVLPYEKVCPSVRSAQGSDFLGAETSPRIGTSGPRCLPGWR